MTGDGSGDLVVAGPSSDLGDGVVVAFPGDGNGGLGAAVVSSSALPAGGMMESGDFELVDVTGDGVVDLVVVGRGSSVVVMSGNGDGTFGPAATTDVGAPLEQGRLLTTGDFTGDGLGDLAVVHGAGPSGDLGLVVIPNRGGGSFGPVVDRVALLLGPTDNLASRASATNLDGNGADDLLLTDGQLGTMLFRP